MLVEVRGGTAGTPRQAVELPPGMFIAALVGAVFGVAPESLFMGGRGSDGAAHARQVAIYLAHTRLCLTFTEAGQMFGRERTTAAHACGTVEDRREEPVFDRKIAGIELALDAWIATARRGAP